MRENDIAQCRNKRKEGVKMYGLYGGTKTGEYLRTIEMLVEKTGKSQKEVAMILYFLHDSQYDNTDLKNMANLAIKGEVRNES
jgi:hypothetical protein